MPSLVMGIDLGTSGVRIAVINESRVLIHSAEMAYPNDLSSWEGWKECCKTLIHGIPKSIRNCLMACAIDGTSGTLLACDKKGSPLGPALPYYLCCSEQKLPLAKILPEGGIASSVNSSLARALRLIKQYGPDLLLRHQSDWITGWLLGNWDWGEESNNLRLGWDPHSKSWPSNFKKLSLQRSLPLIVPSGRIFTTISNKQASSLNLPKDLLIIAGTTDSNAAVLSAELEKDDGLTILGSTIVVKRFVESPIKGAGITNHRILNRWICGGASNTGAAVLRPLFSDIHLKELSRQINPYLDSGLNLRPMPFQGERFPVDDPSLKPIMKPRPVSDSLYLHGIFEGLAQKESHCWQKLVELGAPRPKRIITIGGGAKNPQWRIIRERIMGFPIRTCRNFPAQGAAFIALKAILKKH
ncbi:FGGY-family carbohydrate kinase [Prochlorococcus sp. MIT 1307]|uniref:FGGY-family carbohydrate kinase n=1 Tax=Prochlorococcus sp. MIT 1307 TaxID=3096219 RepID=UPI002A75569D|nr:FGGY-family carbohydrate kinase [Prochlorococcus sp. MIT 1307]